MINTYQIPINKKLHFFKASTGFIAIHTPLKLFTGDILNFSESVSINIEEIDLHENSRFYKKENYYEIKYTPI